jgi:hypothetical protein
MRKLFFLVAAVTISFVQNAAGQISVTQLSVRDTGLAELYLGMPNRIRTSGLEANDEVSFGTAQTQRAETDVYILRGERIGSESLQIKRNGKLIFSKAFKVRRLPDPKWHPGVVSRPYATVSQILTDPRLVVETGNTKDWFIINSFEFAVQSKGTFTGPVPVKGDRLLPNQIELVKQLVSGDKIYFENVKVMGPENALRTFNSAVITIE